eukprot:763066-Hanusia_phi.AAC.3
MRTARGCDHKCEMVCHPGPCLPCSKNITILSPCSHATSISVPCSSSSNVTFICKEICGKLLSCGEHRCTTASCSHCAFAHFQSPPGARSSVMRAPAKPVRKFPSSTADAKRHVTARGVGRQHKEQRPLAGGVMLFDLIFLIVDVGRSVESSGDKACGKVVAEYAANCSRALNSTAVRTCVIQDRADHVRRR